MAGRYYFSPPGTPFFSEPNLLGSRVWDPYTVDDGSAPAPGPPPVVLGESRTAPHRWDAGYLPAAVPSNIVVGSTDCLAQGESLADAVPIGEQIEGFPATCFLPPTPPNADYVFSFAIWRCPVQRFWAQALYLLTWGYAADLASWLAARFTGATVIIESKTVAFPPYAVVIHADYCCGLLAGTQNMQQVLVQALNLFQGPQDVGGFSTGQLWYSFATQVLTLLKDNGVNDTRPILLTGHSYGGASAMIAAARVHLGQPTREIRYLTFGAPKPGDSRLAKLLQGEFNGLSLVNDGDLVGAIPPSSDVIATMADFLPIRSYTGWTEWVYPPESALLFGAKLLKNRTQAIDSLALFTFLVDVATTGQIAASLPHEIGTYVGAISLRCPEQFPVNVGQVLGMTVLQPIDVGEVLGMESFVGPPLGFDCNHGDSGGVSVSSVTWSYGPYTEAGYHVVLARFACSHISFRPRLDGAAPATASGVVQAMSSYLVGTFAWVVPVSSGSGTHTLTSQLNASCLQWVQFYRPLTGPMPTPSYATSQGSSSAFKFLMPTPSDPFGARLALWAIQNDGGISIPGNIAPACLTNHEFPDGVFLVGNYSGLSQLGTVGGTYTVTMVGGGTVPAWVGSMVFIP